MSLLLRSLAFQWRLLPQHGHSSASLSTRSGLIAQSLRSSVRWFSVSVCMSKDGPKELRKTKPRRPTGTSVIVSNTMKELHKRSHKVKYVSAICVGEAFDLAKLRKELDPSFYSDRQVILDQALYSPVPTHDDGTGHVFIFRDGTVVFWNTTDAQIERCIFDCVPACINVHPVDLQETEEMTYEDDHSGPSGLYNETFKIGAEDEDEIIRERLAFSNGLAASAKLAVLEQQLDRYLAQNRHIPQLLQEGKKLPLSRYEVLKQIGALLNFRGKLNLHSELLEIPDIYWTEPKLEELYRMTSKTLDVQHRVSILNKKLDYANELVGVLRDHLSEQHSLKLEWSIIWLIAIEVAFEVIHYADRLGVFDLAKWHM